MPRLGPSKNKEKSVISVLETGLFYCAEWILTVYKRWVTNSWSVMELAGFTHKVSSSVLIWDAETGSTKKTVRRAWKLFWKLDCLAVPNRSWTVYKRWATKIWLAMESASPTESLPQSWSGMLRLGPPKKKEKSVEIVSETGLSCCTEQFFNCLQEMGDAQLTLNRVSLTQSLIPSLYLDTKHFFHQKTKRKIKERKLFQKLVCLKGSWTVYKRWVAKSWPTKESVSLTKSPPKMQRLGSQLKGKKLF